MKVKDLISVLLTYPQDSEIMLADSYCDNDRHIFKICEPVDYEDVVFLCDSPNHYESIKTFEEYGENTWYNIYDTFYMYSSQTDDYLNYKYGDLKVGYENLNKDEDIYDDYQLYKSSEDFRTVGGLKKFFAGVPDGTPVNILYEEGGDSGVINSIKKEKCEYLCGTIDNIDYHIQEELFLVYGVDLYGSDDSLKLEDSRVWFTDNEIKYLIADILYDKLTHDGKVKISERDNVEWSEVVNKIHDELQHYYEIRRRINGSSDSNGYVHLNDREHPFMKYERRIR